MNECCFYLKVCAINSLLTLVAWLLHITGNGLSVLTYTVDACPFLGSLSFEVRLKGESTGGIYGDSLF